MSVTVFDPIPQRVRKPRKRESKVETFAGEPGPELTDLPEGVEVEPIDEVSTT